MLWNSSSNEGTALGQVSWQKAFQMLCYCCCDFHILHEVLCTESQCEIPPGLAAISGGGLVSTKKSQNRVIPIFLLLKRTFIPEQNTHYLLYYTSYGCIIFIATFTCNYLKISTGFQRTVWFLSSYKRWYAAIVNLALSVVHPLSWALRMASSSSQKPYCIWEMNPWLQILRSSCFSVPSRTCSVQWPSFHQSRHSCQAPSVSQGTIHLCGDKVLVTGVQNWENWRAPHFDKFF